jgi:hypothetical protein
MLQQTVLGDVTGALCYYVITNIRRAWLGTDFGSFFGSVPRDFSTLDR